MTYFVALWVIEYKGYILPLLFMKYVSDVWLDYYEQYKKECNDDDERVRSRMLHSEFVLPKGTDFYFLYDQRNEPNFGEIVDVFL